MSLAEASNHLAIHLHRVLSKEKENVFFSPFSISIAMAMLLCGADGETAEELRAALGHQHAGIKKEQVASIFEQQISPLLQENEAYTLASANTMLSDKTFVVKEEYKKIVSDFFKAMLLEVDFNSDNKNVIKHINEWVKEKTKNKIPNFISKLSLETVLVLLNAVYFKGTWMQKFDKKHTKHETFYNHGMENKATKVDMMHMTESFDFYENRDYQTLQMSYIGDEVAMLILLPRLKNGLDSFETSLTPSFIQDIKKKLYKRRVRVTVPRFHLEYTKDLIKSFQELGVQRVFTDADLSNMTTESGLFVNVILHKAVVDVNEEGSEAAAATMVAIARSLPPAFCADHPFLFVIYNTKSDLILFMGRVNEL